jgi:hypothetical protein
MSGSGCGGYRAPGCLVPPPPGTFAAQQQIQVGVVSKAIAMFLQKAWGIRNAYKHGTSVDVFESASERRGADGIDARA